MPEDPVDSVEITSERQLGPFVGLYRGSTSVYIPYGAFSMLEVTLSDTYAAEGGGADC